MSFVFGGAGDSLALLAAHARFGRLLFLLPCLQLVCESRNKRNAPAFCITCPALTPCPVATPPRPKLTSRADQYKGRSMYDAHAHLVKGQGKPILLLFLSRARLKGQPLWVTGPAGC